MPGVTLTENPFRFSTKRTDNVTDFVLYEYRVYSPNFGRWLSRDPVGESAGAHLYGFVSNRPLDCLDVGGLWGELIHYYATRAWAGRQGYPAQTADVVGRADNAVDGWGAGPWPGPGGNLGYHFNRNRNGGLDSRLQHAGEHIGRARAACSGERDEPQEAAVQLGTALHPLQDWVAHGDYFIRVDLIRWFHNTCSPQRNFGDPSGYPDNPDLDDANSFDGRPTSMTYLPNGDSHATYRPGHARLAMTRRATETVLRDFREFVRVNGGCNCRRYFGVE